MINKITIENFQSHKKSELDFVPGINVISGQSDNGKSAIIRAIKWAMTNRPTGDFMCSHWSRDDSKKPTSVTLELDNCTVTRIKNKTKNTYVLDEQEFTAFGSEVPDVINKALNVESFNLQNQLDSPFLLSSSSGEVASYLNKIADLDIIDTSLSNIQKWTKEALQKEEHIKTNIKDLRTKINNYSFLDDLEKDLKIVSSLAHTLNDNERTIRTLQLVVNENAEITSKLSSILKIVKLKKEVTYLSEICDTFINQGETVLQLKLLVNRCEQLQKNIIQNTKITKLKKELNELNELMQKLNEQGKQIQQITNIFVEYEDGKRNREEGIAKYKKLVAKYCSIMPSTCPLCNQEIVKEN